MMAEFWEWLTHKSKTKGGCSSIGEQRQAQQIFESSMRNLKRAEQEANVQRHVIHMAAEDLKHSVHDTIDKMRAGERAVTAAAAAVELLESQKRQE